MKAEINAATRERLTTFRIELEDELENILAYWMNNTIDNLNGGFTGKISFNNKKDNQADKGAVLNSRILWTFSAAFSDTENAACHGIAQRAYDYFIRYFIDTKYGGVYWSVDYKGHPAETKKQVYAQSFAIYALSSFFLASGLREAKAFAIELFYLIEKYSYDNVKGGYIDAFGEDWTTIHDLRLSAKDANAKKTMNTHLHILEAYTNLYRIWPNEMLKFKISRLLQNFTEYIIDKKTGHLVLFFDENWTPDPGIISFGHDIEAAWLLQEAATIIGETTMLTITKHFAVRMADAAMDGLDKDGGLWYEYNQATDHLIKEKHWWPQAEAMVGFFNAWEISGQTRYLDASINSWNFVKAHIRDTEYGEWVWGVHEDYTTMKNHDKTGIWKCPYHNGRACMEITRRIRHYQST